MGRATLENNNLKVLSELAVKFGISPNDFFRELALLMEHHGDLKEDALILDLSGESPEDRIAREEYDPVSGLVISIPDLEAEDAKKLGDKFGQKVWGLPLLHLHTEYVAKALISSIVNGGKSGKAFIPSAVITLAAAFEAAVSEATYIKCRQLFGQNHYKKTALAICKLGPLQRLEALVPLASKGEYVLRAGGTKSVELIRALIPLRNNLMHQNLEFLEFEVVEAVDSPAPYRFEFPEALEKHLERININGQKLQDFWAAYLGLKESFLRSSKYHEDDFLHKV